MTYSERATAMAEKMAKQLRLRGGGELADVVKKAGRRLPKHLQTDAHILAQAGLMADHPKLARQIDLTAVSKAEKRLSRFLDARNPRAERIGRFLDWVAAAAFVVVVIVLAVFFTLLSRGYFD